MAVRVVVALGVTVLPPWYTIGVPCDTKSAVKKLRIWRSRSPRRGRRIDAVLVRTEAAIPALVVLLSVVVVLAFASLCFSL